MTETKSGFIERKLGGKKKGKFMWFSLYGSSLFSYTERDSVQPKTTYQLKSVSILTPEDKKLTIDIKKDNKILVSLAATSKEEFESWKEVLTEATSKDSCSAPTKDKKQKTKGSFSSRLGKATADKISTNTVVKSAVKGVVNEETKLLIVSLKKIIARVENKKVAEEIEDNLVKIITKSFFLEKDKKITMDQFLVADAPLREAFETLVEMRDYRHRMRPETVKQRLNLVHERLGSVEKIITAMLVDHLKPASIQRVARTFGLLGSSDFLDKAWGTPELEEERDLLTDAMNRYTQFNF